MKRLILNSLLILLALPILVLGVLFIGSTLRHACPLFTRSNTIIVPDYSSSDLRIVTDEHTQVYQLRRTQFTTNDTPAVVKTFYDQYLTGSNWQKSVSDDKLVVIYSDYSRNPFVDFQVRMKPSNAKLTVATELWIRRCARE